MRHPTKAQNGNLMHLECIASLGLQHSTPGGSLQPTSDVRRQADVWVCPHMHAASLQSAMRVFDLVDLIVCFERSKLGESSLDDPAIMLSPASDIANNRLCPQSMLERQHLTNRSLHAGLTTPSREQEVLVLDKVCSGQPSSAPRAA